MKKTALVLALSLLQVSNSFAGTFNYACKVSDLSGKTHGKAYLLHVDEGKKVLKFQGKRYSIVKSTGDSDDFGEEGCAKYCWAVKGNGVSFTVSTATQGYAGFAFKDIDWECDNRKLSQRP
jgi:hypothetical protein